jgi:hypothetical protein
MKFINNLSISCAIVASAFSLLICNADCADSEGALAQKGRLLLSDDFTKTPADRKVHDFSEGWQRRLSFGNWTVMEKGGVNVVNVPDEGHGPVLTYLGPVKDVIIECEFRLPTKAGPDRHFRIFLDHPDYRGHTIAAWANLATTFQPLGLTLLHNPKTKDKKVLKEVRFGPKAVNLKPGEWHKMRLELVGKRVRVTVGETVVEGEYPALATTKNKIGLNLGKAGGDLRSFRVWEAKLGK